MQIDATQMRIGLKIQVENDVFVITDLTHVTPGNWRGFYQTKMKSLLTGRVLQRNIRSSEKLETADVEEKQMEYLYQDVDFHFMEQKTYEQIAITREALGDAAEYLKENMQVGIVFWNGRPINVNLPSAVELKITQTEPGVRGDTATNVTKPATMETGLIVQVPIFINEGEVIKVDTRTGAYLGRA